MTDENFQRRVHGISVINLDSVGRIGVRGENLIAHYVTNNDAAVSSEAPPDFEKVIFLRNKKEVGCGQVVARGCFEMAIERKTSYIEIEINGWTKPISLTALQQAAVDLSARRLGYSSAGLDGVLRIAPEFHADFKGYQHSPVIESVCLGSSWRRRERLRIHENRSLSDREKLELHAVLDGYGELANEICDLHDELVLYDFDEVTPYPIVPWMVSSPEAWLDPENYILAPADIGDHFRAGLVTFSESGGLCESPFLTSGLFELGIDPSYRLLNLTARQEHFLRYHRKKVFGKWRAERPLPSFRETEGPEASQIRTLRKDENWLPSVSARPLLGAPPTYFLRAFREGGGELR